MRDSLVDDDDDDYTYPMQRSGVRIDQTQYKVPPLRPVPREKDPFQVDSLLVTYSFQYP